MEKAYFQKVIDEKIKLMEPQVYAFHWDSPAHYGNWLVQTYKYVCHSAPLIKKTADGLPPGLLKDEMNRHYKEEVGHESFALRDAKHFGLDADALPELPETQAMYGYASKSIEIDPASMYGYAFALEHISKIYAPKIADIVTKLYKIDVSKNHFKNVPVSFLTLHGEVDQEHAEEGLQALDVLPKESHDVVFKVMLDTFENYNTFLEGIEKHAHSILSKAQ